MRCAYEGVGGLVVGVWLIVVDQYGIVWAAADAAEDYAWCEADRTLDALWGGAPHPCVLDS